jgi:hypothetical protein
MGLGWKCETDNDFFVEFENKNRTGFTPEISVVNPVKNTFYITLSFLSF